MNNVDAEYAYVEDKRCWVVLLTFNYEGHSYTFVLFNHKHGKGHLYEMHIDLIMNFKQLRKHFRKKYKELGDVNFILRGCKKIDNFRTEEELNEYIYGDEEDEL